MVGPLTDSFDYSKFSLKFENESWPNTMAVKLARIIVNESLNKIRVISSGIGLHH